MWQFYLIGVADTLDHTGDNNNFICQKSCSCPRRRLWGPCRPLSRVNIANIWNGSTQGQISGDNCHHFLRTTDHWPSHNGANISQFRSQQCGVVSAGGQWEGYPMLARPIRSHFISNVVNVGIAQLLGQRIPPPRSHYELKYYKSRFSLADGLEDSCESPRHCCWQFGRVQVWGQGAGIRDQLCRVRRVLTPDTGARTGDLGRHKDPDTGQTNTSSVITTSGGAGCWVRIMNVLK